MKNLTVSLLAVLFASNVFAAGRMNEDQQEMYEQYMKTKHEFSEQAVKLFEENLNSLHYRLIITDGRKSEVKEGQVKKDSTSGAIAESLLEEMKHSLNGEAPEAENTKIRFNCVLDYPFSKYVLMKKLFGKPGRCTLVLKSKSDDQDQKATLTFDMDLVDTPAHKDWPQSIIGPDATLKIEVSPLADDQK